MRLDVASHSRRSASCSARIACSSGVQLLHEIGYAGSRRPAGVHLLDLLEAPALGALSLDGGHEDRVLAEPDHLGVDVLDNRR